MTTLVVDGISASGKSTLLAALQRHLLDTRPNYTKLLLSEHFTERWLEGRGADAEAHVSRVLRLVAELRQLQADGPFAGFDQVLCILIERLFLTLITRGLLTPDFVARQSALIDTARLRSVLLIVPPAEIAQRIATSLTHRSGRWVEYVDSLGGAGAAAGHFAQQQDRMLAANEGLGRHMPTRVIEVTDMELLTAPATLDALVREAG